MLACDKKCAQHQHCCRWVRGFLCGTATGQLLLHLVSPFLLVCLGPPSGRAAVQASRADSRALHVYFVHGLMANASSALCVVHWRQVGQAGLGCFTCVPWYPQGHCHCLYASMSFPVSTAYVWVIMLPLLHICVALPPLLLSIAASLAFVCDHTSQALRGVPGLPECL